MISTLKKKLNKKGFTLAELLIVIAIIAILVAIAIPVFSSQLNSAKDAVIDANMRSAMSMAQVKYLTKDASKADTSFTYNFNLDAKTHELEYVASSGQYTVTISNDGDTRGTITAASHPVKSDGTTTNPLA